MIQRNNHGILGILRFKLDSSDKNETKGKNEDESGIIRIGIGVGIPAFSFSSGHQSIILYFE